MIKKNILIIKDATDTNEDSGTLINHLEEYNVTVVQSHEKAIELFHQNDFDMVLVNMHTETVDFKKLSALVPILQNSSLLLSFEDADKDSIKEKIKESFKVQKMERLKRMLILDSSTSQGAFGLPAFSVN
jgi:DNA-binding NtrC family response regulator